MIHPFQTSRRIRTAASFAAAMALASIAACAAAGHAPAPPATETNAEASLVAAERAFAADAASEGVRAAFLRFADDSAIGFTPEPANVKATWLARPEAGYRLAWYPSFARVSASGDMGVTMGPYRLSDASGAAEGQGSFATVWRRTPAGWRFVVDMGTNEPRPDSAPAPYTPSTSPAPVVTATSVDAAGELMAADAAFASTAASGGFAAAVERYGDPEMRLLRNRALPKLGFGAALAAAVADSARRYTARPARAFASRAGDLGWTYGEYSYVHPGAGRRESGHYVRVWRRGADRSWRVLLDVVAPRPAERDE